MAGKRSNLMRVGDSSGPKICAILGNFTDEGIDIVCRELQEQMPHLVDISLDCSITRTITKTSGKRGKYVR